MTAREKIQLWMSERATSGSDRFHARELLAEFEALVLKESSEARKKFLSEIYQHSPSKES